MKVSRRSFLKTVTIAGATAVAAKPLDALAKADIDPAGLLIDTTKCVGCRACEAACSEANKLPEPEMAGDRAVFDKKRRTQPDVFTVVNKVETGDPNKQRYMKFQCMHCLEPACASACLCRALDKTPEGPVIYHPERCMGCRYCMESCPFSVPTFDYKSPAPYIRKCQFCFTRQEKGQQPACAAACPSGALTFGKRSELIEEANKRIYTNPDKYVHHIYGEHEAGGTSVLYLADVPFEKMGLPTHIGNTGYPELTSGALGLVPFVMTLWPPLLMGIYAFNKGKENNNTEDKAEAKEGRHE